MSDLLFQNITVPLRWGLEVLYLTDPSPHSAENSEQQQHMLYTYIDYIRIYLITKFCIYLLNLD